MTAKEGADKVRRGEWKGYIPASVWIELSPEDIRDLFHRKEDEWAKALDPKPKPRLLRTLSVPPVLLLIVAGALALAFALVILIAFVR